MDAWHRTFDQLRSVFRGLSATQRFSVWAMTAGVLAAMGWLAWSATGSPDEFLLGGKTFTADELAQHQTAFQSAGLTSFRVIGQRISIPAKDVDRYTAATITRQTLPAQFAAEFDRMQAKVNVFTSSEQRRELLEEARKTRLAQILRSIPEIEDAVVEWDRPRQANLFRPAPQLAAQVSVKPRGGRELSAQLIQSLKLFVAGALAGAQTDDVTVVDMNTGRVHGRRSPEAAASEQAHELAKRHESEYAAQIARALGYIPDVLVTVNVELIAEEGNPIPSESFVNAQVVPVNRRREARRNTHLTSSNRPIMRRDAEVSLVETDRGFDVDQAGSRRDRNPIDSEPEFDDQRVTGYQPRIQVAVAIPENYYTVVAQTRGLNPGQSLAQDSAFRAELASIKAETQRDIRDKLARLLPQGSDSSVVSVTTYTPLKPVAKEAGSPVASTQFPFGANLTRWEMGTGIAICGACLLCLLQWCRTPRRMPVTPTPASEPIVENQVELPATNSTAEVDDVYPELNPHPHAAVLAELAEIERRTPTHAVQRSNSFAFLTDLAVWDAARLLENEHPQTIALVATALAPTHAAEILHALPEALRWDVTQRLTRIGTATPEVLGEVAVSLRKRLSSATDGRNVPSPALERPAAKTESVTQTYGGHASLVESPTQLFTFDDLGMLDGRSLATVLEAIDLRTCAIALLDRSEPFKQALMLSMPKTVANSIRQHLRQLGPVRLNEITASQQAIAEVAWNLSTCEMIALPSHLGMASK